MKDKDSGTMTEGDIYSVRLRDGRYGAVRVLRSGPVVFLDFNGHLLMPTTYVGAQKPGLDDARLLEPLLRKRMKWDNNRACIEIFTGVLPPHCEYLGNIPLLPSEQRFTLQIGDGRDGNRYPLVGRIPKDFGREILEEWLWEHDRERYEAERERRIREQQEAAAHKPMKPRPMLDEGQFWEIIGLFDWREEGDDDAVMEPVARRLASMKVAEIRAFEERLARLLYRLDTKEHAKHIGEGSYEDGAEYFSVDSFLYARCLVVAKGRAFYEAVLANPSAMPNDSEFEALLYLSGLAYERRTGREFEYDHAVSYETFANTEGWK